LSAIKQFVVRHRFLIIAAALFFTVLSVMALLLYNGLIWFNNPSYARYPVRGIDVSHHQGKIDWNVVKNNGLHFVFIKATEGADHKDTRFQYNWNQAYQAGFVRGAYHFFTFSKTGMEQAQNFIDTVPNEPDTLPPVIDLELGGNSKIQPDPSTLMRELNAYIEMIENHYQRKPILYTTYEFYDYYLRNQNLPYSIWIRDIFWTPRLSDNKAWLFWQYSNRGRIPGIRGFADLDVFNGNAEEFANLLQSKRLD
jgi:lysozyme